MNAANVQVAVRFRWWFYPLFAAMKVWCWLRLPICESTVERMTRKGTRLYVGKREL